MRLFRLFQSGAFTSHLPARSELTARDTQRQRSATDSQQQNHAVPWLLAVHVLLPITILIVATGFFRFTDADLAFSQFFYSSASDPWPWAHTPLCDFIYNYGTLPGMVLGLGGLTVGLVSLAWHRLRPYRLPGFFLAAMLALGPGLIVNGILKPQWCRPRPCQTAHFGGNQEFVGVWGMGASEQSKSFPSGHASMGFLLMAPAFLLYRRYRRLAAGFVLLGLAAGMALGVTRILQGGHFLSDVVWAAGMVYLTGLALVGLFRLQVLWMSASTATDVTGVRVLVDSEADLQREQDADRSVFVRESTSRRNAA